jgi:phenylacetic acid degradation operon negative regulatory protein
MFLTMPEPPPDPALPIGPWSGAAFGARPDISARSVLVTIFGDSVVPAGAEIWLGDLIELCHQFGFNERLVRTSMFRLGAEGWFETDRVGRRSRYHLTAWAMEEFAAAESRIYNLSPTTWDGQWTLVFLDGDPLSRTDADRLRPILTAHGFVALPGGLVAAPRPDTGEVARLATRAGISPPVPVATARFTDLEALVAAGWPMGSVGLSTVAERYEGFLRRYGSAVAVDLGRLDDEAAFAVRTMVVHDLRRARLADPDLPPEVLGSDWPGGLARSLAGSLYRQVASGAERWLAKVTGLVVTPGATAFRFA